MNVPCRKHIKINFCCDFLSPESGRCITGLAFIDGILTRYHTQFLLVFFVEFSFSFSFSEEMDADISLFSMSNGFYIVYIVMFLFSFCFLVVVARAYTTYPTVIYDMVCYKKQKELIRISHEN